MKEARLASKFEFTRDLLRVGMKNVIRFNPRMECVIDGLPELTKNMK